ncbi:MAG: cysteine desulfurase family protein, partial [Nanoarchaeota archaeon]
IKGIVKASKKNHIITSSIEHASVFNTCESLEGCRVTYVKVDKGGFVSPKEVEKTITKSTALVTIMHANNEVGSIQPVEEIGRICRKRNVPFHTDAVQSFLKVPIDVEKMNISAMSLSSHKVHGPKGVGVAYVREGTIIEPMMNGGRHEFGLRAGTQNVPGIAGFGKAADVWKYSEVKGLRDYMQGRIMREVPYAVLNSPRSRVLPNIINVSFPGLEGESILLHLSSLGVAVSTGSACHEREIKVSHVLNAMGIQKDIAKGAVRFSLSRYTTRKEIDYAVKSLKTVIESLRRLEQ